MRSRRSSFLSVLGLLCVVAVSASALPASAGTPLPNPSSYGRAIDKLADYQPATTCNPTAKPGPKRIVGLLNRTYGTQSTNISRSCGGSLSEHHEGRAIDWMVNARNTTQRARGWNFIHWLKRTDTYGNSYAMTRRTGIMYIIWNGQMWRAYDPKRGGGAGWTEYNSCLTRYTSSSYDTMCHRNHVHMSFSRPGARAETSYYN
ncbi:MAG: hypothetical protein ACRDYU_10385 [Actinomycetes bacterium]